MTKTVTIMTNSNQNPVPKERRCFLPPFKIEQTLTAQEAGDKKGWQITAFDLPRAWKHAMGKGVKVAILDSGCDLDHPDLKDNLKIVPGANFVNRKLPPIDDNAHGTHCAGIIGAAKNGIGVVGVAPECTILPIKVLDKNGNGDMMNVAKAIRFAVNHGADIISMSLGAPFPLDNVRRSILWANKRGVPTFCAAGNAGRTEHIFYPARYNQTIAIGSIDKNFKRSSFSNTGEDLDFLAPGGAILSTIPDDWYGIMSGTSMACPFAVGVAALLLSYVREHKPEGIQLRNAADYRRVIRPYTASVKDKNMAGKKFWEGFGILDPVSFIDYMENRNK